MKIAFKENAMASVTLFKVTEVYEHVKKKDTKVIKLLEGCMDKEEMVKAFEGEFSDEYPDGYGNFCMNIVYSDGRISGTLLALKRRNEKSFSEVMAEIIYQHMNKSNREISALLIRFIPFINHELKPENTFARIFVVGN